jgi:SAM-dependent methyltransferase
MPIGDFTRHLYHSPMARGLCRTFGMQDIHTHYRVKAVIKFFDKTFSKDQELNVLEVGCGGGTNLFEIAKRFRVRAEGYDLDPEHIGIAREICEKGFDNRIQFHVADARILAPSNTFDVILFVDFLEHVPGPEQIVAMMDRCLKPGGVMVVSVPTPLYPKVFGREMHERIGHLLDGYTAETLTALFPTTYSRIETDYSTGPIGSLLCAIQCRLITKIPMAQARWLLATPLLAIHGLDLFASPTNSATLFAVFRKPADVEVGAAPVGSSSRQTHP